MKAVKGKEILLITENKVGKLGEIAETIKNTGISVRAISAWAFDEEAFFRIVASDTEKAKQILSSVGKVEEKDIVIVDLPDEVGKLFELASTLKNNDIDLHYVYGTTSDPGKPAIIVFSSNDDDRALVVISS
tara:strand:+ start:2206 stop:2601 length:396 start_codon:yes stop_codon:yes gene_type:complete